MNINMTSAPKASSNSNVMTALYKIFYATLIIASAALLASCASTPVLQINQNEPSQAFAKSYIAEAQAFLGLAKAFREEEVTV